ncbi:MAG: site-specific DNA-methyltransferase [Pirellulales bacterium]
MAKKKAASKSAKLGVGKSVEALVHDEASRKNIPTAEFQSVMRSEDKNPVRVAYERRNRDLDPQLVWRGKDEQDWSDLVVHAPPLYIQEKVHPKVLIDDLLRQSKVRKQAAEEAAEPQATLFADLYADFNGLPEGVDKTDFYQHEGRWQNRMILGDSLQVMASLAEREGLRGQVQCIYIDPPYGIKFNSNFQWSTTSRDVKDGNIGHITREPEQVKAFRDTWRDGIHSYLTYLRDRLTIARDLLSDSGSVFVQIGDENVHRVRDVLDEVFGDENCISFITFKKTAGATADYLSGVTDYLAWYAKSKEHVKYRAPYLEKVGGGQGGGQYTWIEEADGIRRKATTEERKSPPDGSRIFRLDNITSQSAGRDKGEGAASWFPVELDGKVFKPTLQTRWKTNEVGMRRLVAAGRTVGVGKTLTYVRHLADFPVFPINNLWDDTVTSGFSDAKTYVVQTSTKVVERCLLMATDPGDLVIDPTCGSGTTGYVAEQWGRRWITVDTSRVALALARARIMGARFPYYLLTDSPDGQRKEADVSGRDYVAKPTRGNVRHGFVYERVPHIMLKNIADNAEIDVLWEKWQGVLEPIREQLNSSLKKKWQEWEISREADTSWSAESKRLHADWWQARIARQREIDASIGTKADFEFLYDKPYDDKKKVRVAGPFTVESLSPHRVLGIDENDGLVDPLKAPSAAGEGTGDFARMILENLRTSGVQQAHKEDRIAFTSLAPWPGQMVCAEGRYREGDESGPEKRAAVFIGPEFGTVQREDLVLAAREAGDANFDVLIACAFNYEARSTDFNKLGRIHVLKARMNADLHMAGDLANTGKGNLFVIFGEPDIAILDANDGRIQVKINGVDVFHPSTGEVRSDGPGGIACWFIDTDYNEESFFVRHAYFLGAGDPYKSLKTTLKAEIDSDAWSTLNSDTSRPFPKPERGRIAVKVINHLGDEVMKVFRT